MRKIGTILILSLLCLCFFSACGSSEVTISYIAETGGAVYGELSQTVEHGESCTQVYAVAETGYRFTGWSDGQKSSQRLDTKVTESKTLTAQFEKIEHVTIQYIAEVGGVVYGELSQTVEHGESCTQVYAVAEAGYRFTGWSDGQKSSQRLDINVSESTTLTAQFEKIEYVMIQYIAETGGMIYGESSQTVEHGKNCTQVYAVVASGGGTDLRDGATDKRVRSGWIPM